MTEHMEPFRHLLKSDTPYCWSPILQEKFEMANEMMVDVVTEEVERFDMKRKTCLATDWSNSGIGFFLMQKYCSCEKETLDAARLVGNWY